MRELGLGDYGATAATGQGIVFAVQAVNDCVVAADGSYSAHAYRAKNSARQMAPIDAHMPANFESWIDSSARLARVRYRGAGWDARVEGAEALEPGATVYVLAADGNTLKVSKTRPA